MKLVRYWGLAGLLALLLTGCGFHLRGMIDLPPWLNNVSIVIQNANRDLEPLLTEQLRAWHIKVASDPTYADYWLIIEQDSLQRDVSSISSSTTPRQYQLIYTVLFKLQYAKGKDILPSNKVVVTRQVTINSDRILGSTNEEQQSKSDMHREAAIQILDRLSRAHEH